MAAQLPLIFRKRILAAKTETVLGTAEALTNAEADFRVDDRELKIIRPTIKRQSQGTFGSDASVAGEAHTELTFKSMLYGKGTTGDFPSWGIFLRACGMSLATATYATTMDQTAWKSITAGHYQDGRLKQMVGGMGNFKLTGEAGKPGMFDWNFVGAWRGDPDGASILTGMTYEAVQPPLFANAAAFTFNGDTIYRISKFELDLGNKVSPREDAISLGGYLCGWIDSRDPKLTVDPEAMEFAVNNFYALQGAGTEIGFTIVFGTVAHNICTITGNLLLDNAPQDKDRNGKLVDDLSLSVVRDTLSIVFT